MIDALVPAAFPLARPLLHRLDAETAHDLTLRGLALLPPRRPPPDEASLAVEAFGLRFPNPVGLAAGFVLYAVTGPGGWSWQGWWHGAERGAAPAARAPVAKAPITREPAPKDSASKAPRKRAAAPRGPRPAKAAA